MKISLRAIPKTYSLLSIGQRGVGKTVFLTGSYLDAARAHRQLEAGEQWWLECQDIQEQAKIEQLVDYISRTGKYPPPTNKVTDFNFSLKKQSRWGEQTLYHFRWQDFPGELCHFESPDFRETVFNSNGCCVFINANALLREVDYQQRLDRLMEQIKPIIMLVHLNRLAYPFALLLTKCDLLPNSLDLQELEARLEPITSGFDTFEINYRTFYLSLPIDTAQGVTTLNATGAAQPFLWLGRELEKIHTPNPNSLQSLISRVVANISGSRSTVVEGSLRRLIESHEESPHN